jgi:DNA-binding MarR family transcriptional regulator
MESAKTSLTKRVWHAMFEVLIQSAPQRTMSLARHGLTPNDSRALFSLDVNDGRPMRELAAAWECDPSYATWIVDRLERLGLAERRPLARDRRVKLVVLTQQGQRTKVQLERDFNEPPAEFRTLNRQDLEALERILAKLVRPPEGR